MSTFFLLLGRYNFLVETVSEMTTRRISEVLLEIEVSSNTRCKYSTIIVKD